VGTVVTILIAAGVAAVFLLNREPPRPGGSPPKAAQAGAPRQSGTMPAIEHPIGDPVVKNHMDIAAVWLPAVGMAGMPEPSDDVIHVEADIHATADNPNGFAKDEFVPYLKVHYELRDAAGKALQSGEMLPMVAADGLHYGASLAKPAPGDYKLTYKIEPPSAGGLGRHTDPATGVAPWWEPFEVTFAWTMEPTGPPSKK
jgi:uncharacterized protein involved in high-affinity Fe2+ transport